MRIGPFEFKLGRIYEMLLGDRVISGPFRGIRYAAESVGSEWGPKILGTYEKELAGIIEQICQTDYDVLVNPGAAEGYYAIGLATRMSSLRVIAFEGNEEGRRLLARNAQRNGVADRIDVRGFCQTRDLDATLQGCRRPLVVMDIEGGEMELGDLDQVSALSRADVLVELHDFVHPHCGELIRQRFQGTHRIEEIQAKPRTLADMPSCALSVLGRFVPHKGMRWMDERRNYQMYWYWMTNRELRP